MARKFIDLDEAAKMLGISPDTLNEMRERQKIYGYRDGGSWKFKPEDVERLIADREAVEAEGEFAEMDEDPDSILLSEVELGQSDESTSSTIIGGRTSRKDSAESDIQLASMDSDVQLAQPKHDSDVRLDSAIGDLKSGSDAKKGGSGVSPLFDDLDTLDLEMDSAADSGIFTEDPKKSGSSHGSGATKGTSSLALGSDAMKLDDELKLDEGSRASVGGSQELSLGEATDDEILDPNVGGSAIDLTGDDDGDLVLGGSSHGDLSRSGDSGISLLDPADSGLSLESQPLELGGSAVESLELGEDDMIVTDEPAKKAGGSAAASGIGQEAGGDDDFLLSPLEEASADESDSGSQVIVLVGDEEMEAGGGIAEAEPEADEMGGLLEDDLGESLGAAAGGVSLAAAAAPAATAAQMAAAPAGAGAMALDARFSGWNVVFLILCALMLMFSGMFMFDLLRNMWGWNAPYPVNSWLMDTVLGWFGK